MSRKLLNFIFIRQHGRLAGTPEQGLENRGEIRLLKYRIHPQLLSFWNGHCRWTHSANMQYSLCFAAMLVASEQLYVIGGVIGLQDCEVKGSCKQVIVWSPESQTWCLASTLSKPRHAHAAVYLSE